MLEILNIGAGHASARIALDGLTMRHQAIASNIANVNSEGYRALRVNFEEQLARIRTDAPDAGQQLAAVKPFIEEAQRPNDLAPGVALDMEIVRLNQNTLRFQALVSALGKQMSVISLAVRDGRA